MRRPPSRSSSATTAALMPAQRATCSSIGWSAVGASPRKAYLAISPRPQAHSRGGSDARVSVSHSTALGCQKAPTRFLPSGRLTPGLAADGGVDLGQQRGGDVQVRRAPVVGGGGEARRRRSRCRRRRRRRRRPATGRRGRSGGPASSTVASVLASSPSGMTHTSEGTPGSRPSTQPASLIACWVTIDGRLGAGRHEARHLVAGARADEHRVGAVGQVDGEGVHGRARSPLPARGRRRWRSTACRAAASDGGDDALGHRRRGRGRRRRSPRRPPRRRAGARTASRRTSASAGSSPSSGRPAPSPTRAASVSGRARSQTTVPLAAMQPAVVRRSSTAPPATTPPTARDRRRPRRAPPPRPGGRPPRRRGRRARAPSARWRPRRRRRSPGSPSRGARPAGCPSSSCRRPSSRRAGCAGSSARRCPGPRSSRPGARGRPAADGRRRAERGDEAVAVAHDLGQRVARRTCAAPRWPARAPSSTRPPRPWPARR